MKLRMAMIPVVAAGTTIAACGSDEITVNGTLTLISASQSVHWTRSRHPTALTRQAAIPHLPGAGGLLRRVERTEERHSRAGDEPMG